MIDSMCRWFQTEVSWGQCGSACSENEFLLDGWDGFKTSGYREDGDDSLSQCRFLVQTALLKLGMHESFNFETI